MLSIIGFALWIAASVVSRTTQLSSFALQVHPINKPDKMSEAKAPSAAANAAARITSIVVDRTPCMAPNRMVRPVRLVGSTVASKLEIGTVLIYWHER